MFVYILKSVPFKTLGQNKLLCGFCYKNGANELNKNNKLMYCFFHFTMFYASKKKTNTKRCIKKKSIKITMSVFQHYMNNASQQEISLLSSYTRFL